MNMNAKKTVILEESLGQKVMKVNTWITWLSERPPCPIDLSKMTKRKSYFPDS
jgi:hypothetical protein